MVDFVKTTDHDYKRAWKIVNGWHEGPLSDEERQAAADYFVAANVATGEDQEFMQALVVLYGWKTQGDKQTATTVAKAHFLRALPNELRNEEAQKFIDNWVNLEHKTDEPVTAWVEYYKYLLQFKKEISEQLAYFREMGWEEE